MTTGEEIIAGPIATSDMDSGTGINIAKGTGMGTAGGIERDTNHSDSDNISTLEDGFSSQDSGA